jgi:hypothetical protein
MIYTRGEKTILLRKGDKKYGKNVSRLGRF